MAGLILFIGMFGLLALGSIWNGFVLTLLWAWFIVPTFNLPALTLAPAIGVPLVVGFLTYQAKPEQDGKDKTEALLDSVMHMALKPAVMLAIGWIVKQWM